MLNNVSGCVLNTVCVSYESFFKSDRPRSFAFQAFLPVFSSFFTCDTSQTCYAGSFSRRHPPCRALHASHSATRTRRRCVCPAAALSGRLHPSSFRSLTVVRVGCALRRARALTSSFARRPHPLPHFVQALSAAASTSRFGLQPPSAAVVPLPAGLSVRLRRRAHAVGVVCCCRSALPT